MPLAILAGGFGTRLGRLTRDRPKALVEVNGEPFIGHQLRLLARSGIDQVVLCVGYRGEIIQAVVSNGAAYGLRVEYACDGPTARGTAGALRNALPRLGDT